jgi:hypothetical protein
VLAGYGLLQFAEASLTSIARRQRHRAAAAEVVLALQQVSGAAARQRLLEKPGLPHLRIWLDPLPAGSADAGPQPRERVLHQNRRTLLHSRQRIQHEGRFQDLHLIEDITEEVDREQMLRRFLLVMAGCALLFTGMLLRPVLRRGLVDPLRRFGHALEEAALPPAPITTLEVDAQPQELQPIARSFNALQERLAASWRQERSFIDGAAHELRTPLTLISGYSQRLLRQVQAGGPADPDAVAAISTEAARMSRLVSDLLDLARDDADRLTLRTSPVDLEEALLSAFERLDPLAPGRLHLHPPTDSTLCLVRADPERLLQCLTNLVENALRHTPSGTAIELLSSASREERIAHVRDHGPGVHSADRERIFEPFARGSAQVSGSGLGLAIVKRLMERMGGSVRVRDTPGGGADFQLVFPVVDPIRKPSSCADLA